MIRKIISGGQTGADMAALDFAINTHIPHGGYCPKGRINEDGTIPLRYQLIETSGSDYSERTTMNVLNTDGSLILSTKTNISGGTELTLSLCQSHAKPWFIVDINQIHDEIIVRCSTWIQKNKIATLNVAGNRESELPGIYKATCLFLDRLFKLL